MARVIQIDPKKREARAKEAQINLCWEQREAQIHKYESRNPFSFFEWIQAFKSGWLRQHNLSYWSFPAPTTHLRKQWEESSEPWFVTWREESKAKQIEFLKTLKKKRRK